MALASQSQSASLDAAERRELDAARDTSASSSSDGSSCERSVASAESLLATPSTEPVSTHATEADWDVCPSRWCVTWGDIEIFEREVRELWAQGGIPDDPEHPNKFHNSPTVGPTIHQVNKYYIKPKTLEAGTSWALMRHPNGLKCDLFVTHGWSEGVFEILSALRRSWPRGTKHLYCCFLSNPQNGDVSQIVGRDPVKSPFAKALASAKYMLVVPNISQSIYSRLWCVFEAHLALKRDMRIALATNSEVKEALYVIAIGLVCVVIGWMLGGPGLLGAFQQDWMFAPQVVLVTFVVPTVSIHSNFAKHCCPAMCHVIATFLLGWFLRVCIGGQGTLDIQDHIVYQVVPFVSLALTPFRFAVRALVVAAMEAEGCKLQFDTVRKARCSLPDDQRRIQRSILGKECAIDSAIDVLRTVGRYSSAVQANLDRGMSPERARDRPEFPLLLGSCFLWGPGWNADFSAWYVGTVPCVVRTVCALILYAGARFLGDHSIFLADAFSLCSCGNFAAMYFTDFFFYWIGCKRAPTWIHYASLCVCNIAAILASLLFYSGRCARRAAVAIEDTRDARAVPEAMCACRDVL
jgi:hypothetical protein